MSLKDRVRDAFPGLVPAEYYDDNYPEGIAGHVEAGAHIDEAPVTTPHGPDAMFHGGHVEHRHPRYGGDEQATESVNRRIHEVVVESREGGERKPTTDSADACAYGNVALPDANPRRILIRNPNRKAVVITNQGATTVYVGGSSSIASQGPNTVYLPAGVGRTFTHKRDIWVVGPAGTVVDWVEENYSDQS